MEVSFGGKPCIDASFSLELGFSPSSGSVTMSKRESPESLFAGEKGPYALILADEKSNVVIQELYAKEIEPDEGIDGSAIYRITIQDRRWRWKYRFVSGEFNILTKDKKSVEQFTRKVTQDLVNDCFLALGEFPEGATQVEFGLDSARLPRFTDIKWDFNNPAQELEKIFKELGFVLSLAPDGKLKVFKKGVGTHTVQQNRLINNKKGKKDWEQPTKVIISGGRNIRKVTIPGWEPVVKSDGTIAGFPADALVPIKTAITSWGLSELMCRQAAARFLESKDAWDEVKGLLKKDEELTAEESAGGVTAENTNAKVEKITNRRKIMQECFLKWFRLPNSEYPKQRFSALSTATTNFFRLPILKEIPEFYKPDIFTQFEYVKARHPVVLIKKGEKLQGTFGDAENFNDLKKLRSKTSPTQLYRNPANTARIVIGENSEVQMDYERGIIKFKAPVGRWGKKSTEEVLTDKPQIGDINNPDNTSVENLRLLDPAISVTFAHEDHFVEYKNLPPYTEDNYLFVYPDKSNVLPSVMSKNITLKVIKKPELRLFINQNTPINLNQLNAQAELIAVEYFNNIFPETASEYVYAGFINIVPDGKVTSVNYSFSDSGGLTEVKESDLRTTSKLVFGSPPRFYGGRSASVGQSAKTSAVLGSRSVTTVDDLATRVHELEQDIRRISGNSPNGEPVGLNIINTARGAFIPLADAENQRAHTIFCRIVSRDPNTGTYTIDRVGPAIGPTWNSSQEGWEMGGGSGKFLEWTPA